MMVIMIRAILLYVLIIFAMRFMGKRQIGELQPSELVTTMLISNMAVLPIEDTNIPMLMGAVPILVLVCFEIILSSISLINTKFRKFVSGTPVIIIEKGVIQQKQLKRLRFSVDDLMEGLRSNQIFDLSEVYYAVVETNGKISVLKKFDSQTLTAEMVQIKGEDTSPPTIIISDGQLVKENLKPYQLTADWVNETLKKKHLTQKDVFLMTVDSQKQTTIIRQSPK